MALAEYRSLMDTTDNLCNVMAQYVTNGIDGTNFFILSFLHTELTKMIQLVFTKQGIKLLYGRFCNSLTKGFIFCTIALPAAVSDDEPPCRPPT